MILLTSILNDVNGMMLIRSFLTVIDENASSSTYLIDSYDIWNARLGHVNPTYVMKFQ